VAVMLSKTYEALKSAQGVSEAQAALASEEIADFFERLHSLEVKLTAIATQLNIVTGVLMLTLALVIGLYFKP
jgi:hypothetical protein